MPSYTDYLKLRITNMKSDGDEFFNFDTDLNENFNKIDAFVKAKSNNYNVFCVNTGVVDNDGKPSFLSLNNNVLKTVGTFDITTANGKTYTITDVLQLNISSLAAGKYNVFINPVNKTLTALKNNIYIDSKMPSNAAVGDYLLNTSKVPFSLDKKTSTGVETNLNEVFAGTLEIASGGGKNVVMPSYNKNIIDINLAKKAPVQNMYLTEDVSDEKQGFEQVKQMAHSTFDRSKFEAVGNLSITDEGIASNFSTANYIKLPALESEPQELEINCKFKGSSTSTAPQNQIFGWYDGESSLFRVFWYVKNTLRLDFIPSNATSLVSLSYSGNINDEYIIRIIYKNEVLKLYVNDELAGEYEGKVNLSWLTGTSGKIGSQSIGGWYFGNGLIDLKYFNIKVNGEIIYSGNKTGIDVIKSDNYTVVGTPEITDDGIYSNEIASNYLEIPADFITDNFKLELSINVKEMIQNAGYFIGGVGNISGGLINTNFNGIGGTDVRVYNSENAAITTAVNAGLNTGTYQFTYEYNNGKLSIEVVNPKGTVLKNTVESEVGGITSNYKYIRIGYFQGGSIDLNSVKIFANGDLKYQACLKIPYIESKTGSKIVDAVYRDRVQDIYEQYGTASYYTIDEENKNFTLPMGEIYGMIEKKAEKTVFENKINNINSYINAFREYKLNKDGSNAEFPYVIEHFEDGDSGYRIYSDGWCEQLGIAVGFVEQTFLKPFIEPPHMLCSAIGSENCIGITIKELSTTSFLLENGIHGGNHENRKGRNNFWRAIGKVNI